MLKSNPGLLARPPGAPASPFLRARSEVSGAKTTRARIKGERRPTALGRDSFAEGAAVDCPVSAFFVAASWSEGLPGEESCTRHVPSEVSGVLVRRRGCWSIGRADAGAKTRERPIPSNGACHASYFSSAALPIYVPIQEKSSLATLGGRLGDRISANAVGRRGHFLKGRFPPGFCYEAP